MKATAQRDTACEKALRSALHRLGLRFRLQWPIPGTRRRMDIAFPRARVAVFVDGCFWHGCPEHRTWPKANGTWWAEKLESNVARDRDTDERLCAAGWKVLRFWEHEDMDTAAALVANALRDTVPSSSPVADR
jgi:DNA mismatch endonuclease (patch repair protein)